MFFQLRKQVEVTGCQIQAIRWMGNDVPSKPLQESDSFAGSMGSSVVMEIAYSLALHPSSPVLNRLPEFCQCLTISVNIYCGPSSHEIDQHNCHDFAGRLCLLEFSRLRWRGMQPLSWNSCLETYRFPATNKIPQHHMLNSPTSADYCTLLFFWVHLLEELYVTTSRYERQVNAASLST